MIDDVLLLNPVNESDGCSDQDQGPTMSHRSWHRLNENPLASSGKH